MSSTIETIIAEIKSLKSAAARLEPFGADYPALMCNLKRVQTSIKMLELNFVDTGKQND